VLLDNLKAFESILMLILGWLFGLFTSPIAERIRRHYRRRDLTQAVTDELIGLQHLMAVVSFHIHARYAEVPDKVLDKLISIMEDYAGMDRDEGAIETLRTIRKVPETQRTAAYQASQRPDRAALGLKQYSTPLFIAQISDLAICSLDFQRRVLHIRHHLELYNQQAAFAQSQFEKTFAGLSEENRKILIENQERTYRNARTQAEVIVEAVADLRLKYATG
jgi:hypothetical protein